MRTRVVPEIEHGKVTYPFESGVPEAPISGPPTQGPLVSLSVPLLLMAAITTISGMTIAAVEIPAQSFRNERLTGLRSDESATSVTTSAIRLNNTAPAIPNPFAIGE